GRIQLRRKAFSRALVVTHRCDVRGRKFATSQYRENLEVRHRIRPDRIRRRCSVVREELFVVWQSVLSVLHGGSSLVWTRRSPLFQQRRRTKARCALCCSAQGESGNRQRRG